MPHILDISTAVPGYRVNQEDSLRFYEKSLGSNAGIDMQRLKHISQKTRIDTRYSCIPDFNGNAYELFTGGNWEQPVEKRMNVFKEKLLPLASQAIDALLKKTGVRTSEITHLITVTCTGVTAPGVEFILTEKYQLAHCEKFALNFLGCYAGLKAIKQANLIAKAHPGACILIISTELCSLHFHPSAFPHDIVTNLLFGDGAGAALVCGDACPVLRKRTTLSIDHAGIGYIPGTADYMTWDVSPGPFRMYLSTKVVTAIKENINEAVGRFMGNTYEVKYWAVHPGGIKIVEAIRDQFRLNEADVSDSLAVLRGYGNMSSATIFFVLERILENIRAGGTGKPEKIFSCAFGPGLNIEMVSFTSNFPLDFFSTAS